MTGLIFEHGPYGEWSTIKLSWAISKLNTWGMTCYMMGDLKLLRLTGCFLDYFDGDFDEPTTINIFCVSRRVEGGGTLVEVLDVHSSNRELSYL